jgi:hypothetical protein
MTITYSRFDFNIDLQICKTHKYINAAINTFKLQPSAVSFVADLGFSAHLIKNPHPLRTGIYLDLSFLLLYNLVRDKLPHF